MLCYSIGLTATFDLCPLLLVPRGTEEGLTPLELAAGDERLVDLLTNYCCTHDDVMNSAFDG